MSENFPIKVPNTKFDQRNEMFKRRTWDPEFIEMGNQFYKQVKYQDRNGYRKLDYALRNAAWSIEFGFASGVMKGNHGLYQWDYIPKKIKRFIETGDKVQFSNKENSQIIKRAAKFFGAALAGICYAHPNLIYSKEMDLLNQKHHDINLPKGCDNAIILAVEMDYETLTFSPDAISGASTGLGYSKQAVLANLVATFIRGLGYKAIPSGNDTALSIPLALAAGLGELGRNGLLITKKYGPRVRLCKVFTDMPLAYDQPDQFGVKKFCKSCKKCADHCPSNAISKGDETLSGLSLSNFSGVKRWYIHPEKCFTFWVNNWMDCNNCVKVCPFNKSLGSTHDLVRAVIKKMPILNGLIVKMDDFFGYGKPIPQNKKNFWEL